eukprot:NODE_6383_length_1676_cov_20.362169.p1 GENE.NODE_6383_length_1676_cov_20.362169~~NODE_6383_length_1676_cov_20.362169.p1  ORF type:complete len:474 (+),score=139.39 NODE_6383_length_1676_cov_20.362169:62-1423(+)
MAPSQRRLLVVGGAFSGLCVGRDLSEKFLVTIVDAKEYFEYTPGILRAYVHPSHFNALTFNLQPVIETRMGCKFIWGEVTKIDGPKRTATIKPMFLQTEEVLDFDFCVIASGCNFGPFHKHGQSLWFPTVQQEFRLGGDWPHLDERYIEGRRRHILEEYEKLNMLNERSVKVLVVGMGFIGVEWATELRHYFPNLKVYMVDFAKNALGPLPAGACRYAEQYLIKKNVKFTYNLGYAPEKEEFWNSAGLPNHSNDINSNDYVLEYICVGVKASNTFMPPETLNSRGWIAMDMKCAVVLADDKSSIWSADGDGYPRVYAVGDCNDGEMGKPRPVPKISYPGEEQAVIVAKNICKVEKLCYTNMNCKGLHNGHWPWGAGMFATSLGPNDACFVSGANWEPNSGKCILWGRLSAWQKWIIEWSKIDECKYGVIGRCIWHFVHHTPVHLFGGGPRWGY